ncbi:MAG: hypothetical protein PHY56_00505 [Candidatus Omnitrophica bacterium]|nr:hypothetical protein [Candidatus Omnitrophota bacterium]
MAACQILAVKLYLLDKVILNNRLLFWNLVDWPHEWLEEYIYGRNKK